MQRSLIALVLGAACVVPAAMPAFAAGEDPSCSDFMAMTETDRIEAVEQLAGAVPDSAMSADTTSGAMSMEEMGTGGEAGGTMASDNMAANAMTACESNPSSSLSEAVKMMGDG